MANKKQPNWAAWALKFVGSLVYLYVVWWIWQNPTVTPWLGATLGALFFGLSVVAAVALFIVTLASLAMPGDGAMMNMHAMKMSMVTGISLLALLGPSAGTWSLAALVGFILTYLGAGMAMGQ